MRFRKGIAAWPQRVRDWLVGSEVTKGMILATLVGVAAGLGAVAFRWLISSFHSLFMDGGEQAFGALGRYYIIIIPALGGLLVGLIIYFFAREARGHGVPAVSYTHLTLPTN